MEISIVIPVYNEAKILEKIVDHVKRVVKPIKEIKEIILVNDGSSDRTGEVMDRLKGVRVLHNPYNLGYGASIKKGIKEAKGTHILITDADGTYPIDDIPKLVNLADKYDMVVGARTGKKVHIPFMRRPAKFVINKLAEFLAGRKIPDLNSGFRVFSKELAMRFYHLFPSRFSLTTTITLASMTNDYTVKYFPINYYKRHGKSTIRPIGDFIGFLNLIVRIITYFKPFKIFFTISLVLFLMAVAVYCYTFFVVGKIMDATVMAMFLASLQIFLSGIIADLIVKRR